jgi:hypothetical protein
MIKYFDDAKIGHSPQGEEIERDQHVKVGKIDKNVLTDNRPPFSEPEPVPTQPTKTSRAVNMIDSVVGGPIGVLNDGPLNLFPNNNNANKNEDKNEENNTNLNLEERNNGNNENNSDQNNNDKALGDSIRDTLNIAIDNIGQIKNEKNEAKIQNVLDLNDQHEENNEDNESNQQNHHDTTFSPEKPHNGKIIYPSDGGQTTELAGFTPKKHVSDDISPNNKENKKIKSDLKNNHKNSQNNTSDYYDQNNHRYHESVFVDLYHHPDHVIGYLTPWLTYVVLFLSLGGINTMGLSMLLRDKRNNNIWGSNNNRNNGQNGTNNAPNNQILTLSPEIVMVLFPIMIVLAGFVINTVFLLTMHYTFHSFRIYIIATIYISNAIVILVHRKVFA